MQRYQTWHCIGWQSSFGEIKYVYNKFVANESNL
ncbi:hypothetical protein BpHYR1_001759 [Brachionus plicatilis]|uniref:Uncharacterized protein n=1 Tax=Brachionus plicatilis TaxID=10195 RepID=A0A3M7P8W4_BRAPC|nr:hypothetical protein BpHYR1_001759 [Brachionus plicatilis]